VEITKLEVEEGTSLLVIDTTVELSEELEDEDDVADDEIEFDVGQVVAPAAAAGATKISSTPKFIPASSEPEDTTSIETLWESPTTVT
jgi:hypothetical protein